MNDLSTRFSGDLDPAYKAKELTALVDYETEGVERIVEAARSSRSLAETTQGAGGEIAATDGESGEDFAAVDVPLPREVNLF
ncbi:hypothetical protein BQ8420_18620 [Nocardiopsis sp. JB363]|nr:hypothetical protein BQ8420_18620 [Nocardiopsis sp. JB363]